MTKHLILLVTQEMKPVPKAVEVVHVFGPGVGIDDSGYRVEHGEACHVSGEPEALHEWLRPLPGFWTSEAPAVGNWKFWEIPTAAEVTRV